MVGRSNTDQMQDLLRRLLASGRPRRFVDYWGKRSQGSEETDPKDVGIAVEIDRGKLRKKMGRPRKDSLRVIKTGRPDRDAKRRPPVETSSADRPVAVKPPDSPAN
jgi:hypothetical protein